MDPGSGRPDGGPPAYNYGGQQLVQVQAPVMFQNQSKQYTNKGQLTVVVGLSLAMNLIYFVPTALVLLYFFTLLAYTNEDDAMYWGIGVSAFIFVIGFFAVITDIILCCHRNILSRSSTALTYWIVIYFMYMGVFGVHVIMIIVGLSASQDQNYDKVWLSDPQKRSLDSSYHGYINDDPKGLPKYKAVSKAEAEYYMSQSRYRHIYYESEAWEPLYVKGRDCAVACLLTGVIILLIRGYFHYVAFKVRKAVKYQLGQQSPAAEQRRNFSTGASQSQPAVIPQYHVGNDGGSGAPYYNNSNAYPPMEEQH